MRYLLLILYIFIFVSCNFSTDIPPAEIVVEAPKSVASKFEPTDSTYLKVKMQKEGYFISLLNDSLKTKNIADIDSFMTKHDKGIDKNKILFISEISTKSNRFTEVKNIFKKNEIYKFQIVTLGD
jgi:biopolymer transport protein ExbD